MQASTARRLALTLGLTAMAIGLATCGGGTEPSVAPAPVISGLVPDSIVVGGPAQTLSVSGQYFESGAKVRWNGSDRTTSYVSGTRLTAVLLATDLDSVATGEVTVLSSGARTSKAAGLPILPTTPAISALAPDTVIAGAPGVTLTVTGQNFDSLAVVRWNGASRPTTFLYTTRLSASLGVGDVRSLARDTVTVASPGRRVSRGATLVVLIPAPIINALTPDSLLAGTVSAVIAVTGSNFDPLSLVQWNGSGRVTTFLADSVLSAVMTLADMDSAGRGSVSVFRPISRGSNAISLVIANGLPSIVSVSPASLYAGSTDTPITISGSGLMFSSAVTWDGIAVATTLSGTTLHAQLPAGLLGNLGPHTIRVLNPRPAGGTSAAWTYMLTPAPLVPVLARLIPDSVDWAAYGIPVSVRGAEFTVQSQVLWAGVRSQTQFVADVELLSFPPPPLQDQTPGPVSVTVYTPPAGGGTSNALPIVVRRPAPTLHLFSVSPDFAVFGTVPVAITVHGSLFTSKVTVYWDGVPAASFAILNDSTATLTPADFGLYPTFYQVRVGPLG